MESKKPTPANTVTRKMIDLDQPTGNIYESVAIISKRANQISSALKTELMNKLDEFTTTTDSLEETFENREQIEISRYYERMPKPTLIATEEFLAGDLYFRDGRSEGEERDGTTAVDSRRSSDGADKGAVETA